MSEAFFKLKFLLQTYPNAIFLEHPDDENYLIGDNGVVVSLKRKNPKILKGSVDKHGFKTHHLAGTVNYTARLVAVTHLSDSYFDGAVASHKSSNTLDNSIDNLHWVSRIDVIRKRHGFEINKSWTVVDPKGNTHTVTSTRQFAKEHGLWRGALWALLNKKRYRRRRKKINDEYQFDPVDMAKSCMGWTLVDD